MKSPRLNVSLPVEVMETVSAIAHAQGVSQSAVVRDVLVETMPVLAKVAAMLTNVRKMEAEKGAAIRGVLDEAQREAEQAAATMMALMAKVERSTEEAALPGVGAERPRPSKKAARRASPPSC